MSHHIDGNDPAPRSYIPRGCDQQGRFPQAAEAATDVGVEDDYDGPDPVRAVIIDVATCCALLAIIYLIVWAAIYG